MGKEIEALVVKRDIEHFTDLIPVRRNFFRVTFKPIRRGVSQQVLEIADRAIEEYKADLDYLKDR